MAAAQVNSESYPTDESRNVELIPDVNPRRLVRGCMPAEGSRQAIDVRGARRLVM